MFPPASGLVSLEAAGAVDVVLGPVPDKAPVSDGGDVSAGGSDGEPKTKGAFGLAGRYPKGVLPNIGLGATPPPASLIVTSDGTGTEPAGFREVPPRAVGLSRVPVRLTLVLVGLSLVLVRVPPELVELFPVAAPPVPVVLFAVTVGMLRVPAVLVRVLLDVPPGPVGLILAPVGVPPELVALFPATVPPELVGLFLVPVAVLRVPVVPVRVLLDVPPEPVDLSGVFAFARLGLAVLAAPATDWVDALRNEPAESLLPVVSVCGFFFRSFFCFESVLEDGDFSGFLDFASPVFFMPIFLPFQRD